MLLKPIKNVVPQMVASSKSLEKKTLGMLNPSKSSMVPPQKNKNVAGFFPHVFLKWVQSNITFHFANSNCWWMKSPVEVGSWNPLKSHYFEKFYTSHVVITGFPYPDFSPPRPRAVAFPAVRHRLRWAFLLESEPSRPPAHHGGDERRWPS